MIDREVRLGIIVKVLLAIQEASQTRDLRAKVHHDNLHADVELESEDIAAGPECLLARRDEHVPVEAELLEVVDELAELGAPA